jgi:ATP-dependent Zn protease
MKKDRKAQPAIERLRRVEHHEAGHVAVALRERIAIRDVTIVPGEGYLGLARNRHAPSFFKAAEHGTLSSARAESFVLVCLAGAAAEKRFCGRYDHVGAGADYDVAIDMLTRHAGSIEEVSVWLKLQAVRVRQVVDIEWETIELIAEALLEWKTLTAFAVRSLLRKREKARSLKLANMFKLGGVDRLASEPR